MAGVEAKAAWALDTAHRPERQIKETPHPAVRTSFDDDLQQLMYYCKQTNAINYINQTKRNNLYAKPCTTSKSEKQYTTIWLSVFAARCMSFDTTVRRMTETSQ